MKILITEAVNSAIDAFFDALGNDSYKEQYGDMIEKIRTELNK